MAISHNGDISSSFSKTFWEEREIQKTHWKEHSADLSVEDLDNEERSEILALLPEIEGKSVLEFGAGISRFSGELAQKAGHLIAVDFIDEKSSLQNEKINGQYKNVKFMYGDVTSPDLNFSNDSMDLIFSNCLLMFLSEKEVRDLAKRMLQWMKVGGHIFFRESCFLQSRDSKRKYNPTHYREPRFYTKIFKECHMYDDDGNSFEFSLVTCKCIGADVRNKKDQNQRCWIWQKVCCSSDNERGFQRSLDIFQYKSTGVIRSERVFGRGFDSTGGIETTKEFVGMLDLKAGQKVLDVGCGIGGSDFYMAENFDVHVVGIDISIDVISLALEDAICLKCSVEFEVADCSKKEYPDNTFDVIYSRDTILHVQDKPALFKKFYKWLKPGGKVLITDYCRSLKAPSSEFAEVIKKRGFYLHDIHTYGQMLKDAGFDEVIAEDRTDQFIKVFKREIEAVEKEKDEFINDFSKEGYKEVLGAWNRQILRSLSDEQKWGLFIAKRI